MLLPKILQVPVELVQYVHNHGKLPVVNFAAGGIATPADVALLIQFVAEWSFLVHVFCFKSGDPIKRAALLSKAVTHCYGQITTDRQHLNLRRFR